MKKFLTLVVTLLLGLACVFGLTACGQVKYPVSDGKLTVVTNCPFGNYEYIGQDGKIYGIDIEIAGLFAEDQGLELVVKNIDFDAIFTSVDTGKADVGMAGITITDSRQRVYDFTDTYCKASQKLIVLEDNTTFDGQTTAEGVEEILSSLTEKKIGFQTGTTGGMYINGNADFEFDGFSNIEGKNYDTAVIAIQDMKNGNIFAVVVDEGPAAVLAQNIDGIKVVDVKLTDEDYAFVMKKGNQKLQNAFNEFIAKIKENGVYAEIEAKYYQGIGEKVGYNVSVD